MRERFPREARGDPSLWELRGNGSAVLKLSFNTSKRRRLFRSGRSYETAAN